MTKTKKKSINLWNGDCLELMKKIPDKSVDLILTDPPYGTTACKWDNVIPFDLMWEQLNRIIKDNGAIVLFGSEPFSSALRMSNLKMFKYDWIWVKSGRGGVYANKMPIKNTEVISVFYKKQPTYSPILREGKPYKKKIVVKTHFKEGSVFSRNGLKDAVIFNFGTRQPINNINFKNDNSKSLHPTQKPVALLEYLIKTYTLENETVLDFTMGSGSTGVACINTNRKFIGIEKDEKYFQIAKDRINEATKAKK